MVLFVLRGSPATLGSASRSFACVADSMVQFVLFASSEPEQCRFSEL
jgi:hypothetical protein